MKIPTELLDRVLIEWGLQVKLATNRDRAYVRSRVECEGMEFLTISLPSICDALDKGLANGRITPSLFTGFKPWKRGGSLPAFMSGFFMRIFNLDGVISDRPCIDSIRAIREVSRLFKKVEMPCSDRRVKSAYERYVKNDESILGNNHRGPIDAQLFADVNRYLWSDLEILSGELYCFPGKFGSGACAERFAYNHRHDVRRWPRRSEKSFPSDYHTTHDYGNSSVPNGITLLDDNQEEPVRVVDVPKTLKTPRIISVEPSYMMLMQQSIAKFLMVYIESESFPYSSIRFTNQSVNREQARAGSVDGMLSTIDLKDASDLVNNDLVKVIFKDSPTFLDYILDCRTKTALLPGGTLVKLNKFASMGSALCFPIEAMVFFSIICYSILRQRGLRPSTNQLRNITADVSVYGDDIIVPTDVAIGVMEDLEIFGLSVNQDKSFFTGFFRESCGGDYYKGHDVTPTYVRRWDFSNKTHDVSYLASNVSLANQFYLKGLWGVSKYIRKHIASQGHNVPTSIEPVGVLHFTSFVFTSGARWNPESCKYEIHGPLAETKSVKDRACTLPGNMLRAFGVSSHEDALRTLDMRFNPKRHGLVNRNLDGLVRLNHDVGYADVNGSHISRKKPINEFGSYAKYRDLSLCDLSLLRKADYCPHLKDVYPDDLYMSIKPYALKLKRRWTPTNVGLHW